MRLIENVWFQSARERLSRAPARKSPALLTSTSQVPQVRCTSSAAAVTLAASDVSHSIGSARPPSARSSVATSSHAPRLRSSSAVTAPAPAIAVAMARPIPLPAPVTTQTRPPSPSQSAFSLMGARPFGYRHLVPLEGLEPPLPCEKQILSLPRLPFRHRGCSEVAAANIAAATLRSIEAGDAAIGALARLRGLGLDRARPRGSCLARTHHRTRRVLHHRDHLHARLRRHRRVDGD